MKFKIVKSLNKNIWTIRNSTKINDINLEEMEFSKDITSKILYVNLNHSKEINRSYYFEMINKNKIDYNFEVIQIDLNSFNEIKDIEFIYHILFLNYSKIISYKQSYKFIDLEILLFKDNLNDKENEYLNYSFYEFNAREFAKYLSDKDPGEEGTPIALANTIKKLFVNKNIETNILDLSEIKKSKLSLIEAVSQGSHREPRLVVCEYNGDKKNSEKLVLVGKGITFDTGGYSLKTADGMKTMRLDKCGACNAVAILNYVSKNNMKINLSIVTPFSENSIGGGAIFPGQVIKTLNGKTVQVDNTDAEGRLVLADALTYSVLNLKPTEIIEMSTLTGAITIALGKYMTGCFTNNYEFANNFKKYSEAAGDELWILPIHRKNVEMIKSSELADLTNSPIKSKHGGPSQAAAFLNEFVPQNIKFIHLDLGGTGVENNRATGSMVRGIINYINNKK